MDTDKSLIAELPAAGLVVAGLAELGSRTCGLISSSYSLQNHPLSAHLGRNCFTKYRYNEARHEVVVNIQKIQGEY